MLFNSLTFICFFLVIAISNAVVPHRYRLLLLFSSSLIFYSFWRFDFVFVMLFSAIADFLIAKNLESEENLRVRRRWLYLSLSINIGLLLFFKYLLFFSSNFSGLLNILGEPVEIPAWMANIVLPLGISFYTFQTISYTVDVYRGHTKAEKNFVVFGTYVTFFPQLIAGPILRAKEVIPQLKKKYHFEGRQFFWGLRYIVFGLFLKVVLADNISPLVDVGFETNTQSLSVVDVFTLSFLFGYQIYFDFAAYSMIAIGCARCLGLEFPENFNFPYSAVSPKDFWKRWHISLGSWIRDYLYLPLSGQAVRDRSEGGITYSPKGTIAPLFGTWAIMGLWHGANWTFVIWGLYHATMVYAHRLLSRSHALWSTLPSWVFVLFTLPIMMLGWIPFRAENVSHALQMWAVFFDPSRYFSLGLRENSYLVAASLSFAVLGAKVVWEQAPRFFSDKPVIGFNVYVSLITFLLLSLFVFLRPVSQFIYFQF